MHPVIANSFCSVPGGDAIATRLPSLTVHLPSFCRGGRLGGSLFSQASFGVMSNQFTVGCPPLLVRITFPYTISGTVSFS
jgi:hypothetical protein